MRWHHQLNGHEFEQTPGECRTEESGVLESMRTQRVDNDLLTEQQQDLICASERSLWWRPGKRREKGKGTS